jgi:hypothetical protein
MEERSPTNLLSSAFEIDFKRSTISVRGLDGDHFYQMEKEDTSRGEWVGISSSTRSGTVELRANTFSDLPEPPQTLPAGEIYAQNFDAHLRLSANDTGKQLKALVNGEEPFAYGISLPPKNDVLPRYRRGRECIVELTVRNFGIIYYLMPILAEGLSRLFGPSKAGWWVEYIPERDKQLAPVAGILAAFADLFFQPERVISDSNSG